MDNVFSSRLAAVEKALDDALPLRINTQWRTDSFGSIPGDVRNEHLQCLTAPCKDLITLGGKRWRPLLLVLCAENARSKHGAAALLSADDTYRITPLVEFVHTASLIHDDIEDDSDTRRGKPAAYVAYGLDTALNAASWLYFEAPVCIDRLAAAPADREKFYALYARELRRLHLGQAMDIYWHRQPELFPEVSEYTAMVRCKTGTLASLAAQAGILAGGGTDDEAERAGAVAAEIGEGFQVLDDVQNLTTGNPGKKRGDDVVEGKKSLPVLLHVKSHPQDKKLIASYFAQARKDGIDSPAVEQCISLLTHSGAVDEAFSYGKNLAAEKSRELAGLYDASCSGEAAALIISLFDSMTAKQEVHHAQ
ncbi:MAG TPA: polyprenyl synthetase family protein [Treponema sp.]|nr:polyprenyl synthetase family protein [Treponema sp.]